MGERESAPAAHILNAAAIPTFRTPEAAVDAFSNIASFHQNQQMLHQVPPPLTQLARPDIEGARLLIENVLAERRKVLTEMESKALLSSFHIPVTKTILARNANEAILVANQLGYPVALKIDSPDISHKSDVHGVVLNVPNATARARYLARYDGDRQPLAPGRAGQWRLGAEYVGQAGGREFYIGVITDEPFGPVIAFGAGGTMIELISDRAIELPPLEPVPGASPDRPRARLGNAGPLARRGGGQSRRAGADFAARVGNGLRFAATARNGYQSGHRRCHGALVVDARIVVERTQASPGNYQHLAILPYPSDRETEWPMRNGSRYIIRPVHPHDAEMLQSLVRGLSPESRYFRYFSSMHELSDRMLARFTLIDYDREMALVAIYPERKPNAEGGFDETERIIGVSRYVTNPDKSTCEFALVVADEFSGQGIGSRMMLAILDVARSKGLTTMEGLVLTKNVNMLKLMRALTLLSNPARTIPTSSSAPERFETTVVLRALLTSPAGGLIYAHMFAILFSGVYFSLRHSRGGRREPSGFFGAGNDTGFPPTPRGNDGLKVMRRRENKRCKHVCIDWRRRERGA